MLDITFLILVPSKMCVMLPFDLNYHDIIVKDWFSQNTDLQSDMNFTAFVSYS